MKKRILLPLLFLLLLFPAFFCCGCKAEPGNMQKIKDLDFTVIDPDDAPQKLKDAMESRREKGFKLTYLDNDSLYIARGYTRQPSAGYHICVEQLYLTKNGIFFDACLYGPKQKDVISRTNVYPCIVVKLPRIEGIVIFN